MGLKPPWAWTTVSPLMDLHIHGSMNVLTRHRCSSPINNSGLVVLHLRALPGSLGWSEQEEILHAVRLCLAMRRIRRELFVLEWCEDCAGNPSDMKQ